VADVQVPGWTADAVAASRSRFNEELESIRARIQSEFTARQQDELGRAERIFRYREQRLRRRIEEDAIWIRDKERTGNERERRILPARRGKLVKDQERVSRLASDFERQVEEITQRRAEVTGTLWAAAVVVGP
jgi:hypothetical protein